MPSKKTPEYWRQRRARIAAAAKLAGQPSQPAHATPTPQPATPDTPATPATPAPDPDPLDIFSEPVATPDQPDQPDQPPASSNASIASNPGTPSIAKQGTTLSIANSTSNAKQDNKRETTQRRVKGAKAEEAEKAGEATATPSNAERSVRSERSERMEPAAVVLSPALPIREGVQKCTTAQKCTSPARLPSGNFPKRVQLCEPATPEQLETAKGMMIRGEGYNAIIKATGSTWAALRERSFLADLHEWQDLCKTWRMAQAGRVLDKACRVANQEEPAITRTVSGPMGITTTEERRTDPAMLGQIMAGLLPDIHGKGAGRSAPSQINVAGNAQIFGGQPTPGTLDDFDA